MRKRAVSTSIRRAVLIAILPACGGRIQPNEAGDAQVIDATTTADAIGPPEGCIIGKPSKGNCGYSETINDPTLCLIDIDAEANTPQDPLLCKQLCSPDIVSCGYYYPLEAGLSVFCQDLCGGRLNEDARAEILGHCERPITSAGAALAHAAYLEAASIDAFDVLARELRDGGAPRRLVRDAERAAKDEVRHARTMGALARRYGTSPQTPRASRARRRTLVAIALENVVEGCVRETYGAAVALWQSKHAGDPRIRAAMKSIAKDEIAHADLGWRVDAWLRTKLTEAERARVESARKDAVRGLGASLAEERSAARAALGTPDEASARAIFDELRRTIWS